MAPVGVFGTLDAKSHGAVALVYVVATVAMAFTAFSYAQMVRVVPQAGSVFAYARVGLGREAGFIAGWMAMLDYVLIPAVAYLFSGIAMNALVPDVSRWVWTALAVVITTCLNLWGVRAAARVGFLVLAMEIVVLIIFVVSAIVVLARDGAERGWLSPLSGDGTQGAFALSAVIGAVSVAVLSYLGFDAVATFAEEVTGGSEKVARALLFCLALAACAVHRPDVPGRPPGADDFRTAGRRPGQTGIGVLRRGRRLGRRLAAQPGRRQQGDRRGVRGAGRAGGGGPPGVRDGPRPAPPRALSKTDSGVPRVALLSAAVITLIAAVWAARRDDGLDHLVSVVDIGALTAFTLLHASVVGWFAVRRQGGPVVWWRHVLVPVLGAAITIAVIVEASGTAQVVGAIWLAVGVVVLAVQSRGAVRE